MSLTRKSGVVKDAENGVMEDEDRERNIEVLQRIIDKLRAGKEADVRFVVASTHREDVEKTDDGDEGETIVAALWGPVGAIMPLLASLSRPLIEEMLPEIVAKERGARASAARGLHPDERELHKLDN